VDPFIRGTKHGIESGYYSCLFKCLFGDIFAPFPGWLLEHGVEELAEHSAGPAARSYYTWKYPKWFRAGGVYSKVLVPRAVELVKAIGRGATVIGLAYLIYEEYACTKKCIGCL
jgi:hypothetical protein